MLQRNRSSQNWFRWTPPHLRHSYPIRLALPSNGLQTASDAGWHSSWNEIKQSKSGPGSKVRGKQREWAEYAPVSSGLISIRIFTGLIQRFCNDHVHFRPVSHLRLYLSSRTEAIKVETPCPPYVHSTFDRLPWQRIQTLPSCALSTCCSSEHWV